ncbi:RICIN domain-containing protein [Amycolatopsis sp. NPDC051071]|uniref:RICIN domain-containing protein n=1 Tax=Amycolatopsis sp. NPDC051071 TaxID=3154637 RepID=UPI0034351DEF
MTLRTDLVGLLAAAGIVDVDDAIADEHVRSAAYQRLVSVAAASQSRDGDRRIVTTILRDPETLTSKTVVVALIQIKGVHSGRCIQVAGLWGTPNQGANADLAGTELRDCAGGVKQVWELIPLGDKKYGLKNKNFGKCLDVRYGEVANGTPLIQFGCHYGGAQQWVFVQGDNNTLGLASALTGKFADVAGWQTGNGAGISQYDGTGGANQRWTIIQMTTA